MHTHAGLIREEGGKMYMSEGQWIDAYNELYEAFRNYQVQHMHEYMDIWIYA